MFATKSPVEDALSEEYFTENERPPTQVQTADTKDYWDEQMKNRDPIKLPYWVVDVDDGGA